MLFRIKKELGRAARASLAVLLLGSLAMLVGRLASDVRVARQRGRFAVQLIHEQMLALQQQLPAPVPLQLGRDSGKSVNRAQLQAWLISRIRQNRAPAQVANELDKLSQKDLDPVLVYWRQDLRAWIAGSSCSSDPDSLLAEGRCWHARASGYARVGLGLEASVLFLRAAETFVRFVQMHPTHPDLPEALFLIGTAYLNLKPGVSATHANRILGFCVELFPDTVWGERARRLRNGESDSNA